MMRNAALLVAVTLAVLLSNLTGCGPKKKPGHVRVGIIDGPATTLWELAKAQGKQQTPPLTIELVTFNDYTMPNEALHAGDIDANAFQHRPFLEAQNKTRGYDLMPMANTFLFPMAMYAQKITKISELKAHSRIAIPNDPSNEARALLLLAQHGLIKLRSAGAQRFDVTPADISDNPKHLRFIEMDAAQLPRALPDVAAAIINDDFAEPAGLNPHKALLSETKQSPYMNIIVVRAKDRDDPTLKRMVKAFQTPAVIAAAMRLSDGTAVVGW